MDDPISNNCTFTVATSFAKIGGRGVIASAVQRVDHVGIRIDVEYPVVNVSNDNVGNIEYHEQPR